MCLLLPSLVGYHLSDGFKTRKYKCLVYRKGDRRIEHYIIRTPKGVRVNYINEKGLVWKSGRWSR